MDTNTSNLKDIKKTIMTQLKQMKVAKNASAEEHVEGLVKQAEFYTEFLLAHHRTRED